MKRLATAAIAVGMAFTISSLAQERREATDSLTDQGDGVALLAPIARIEFPAIDESSGIEFLDGWYYTHNDSGGDPVLYRSRTLDFAKAQTLAVPGADAVDWEEITVFEGDLLVCDIGDNGRRRDDLMLYRVRVIENEKSGQAALETVARYPMAWPDGKHDCEAVATIGGRLHLIVKNRGEEFTGIYRFETLVSADDLKEGKTNTPELVGKLDFVKGEQATAADVDEAGETLVVLTYARILCWPTDRLEGAPAREVLIDARQCEALCFHEEQVVFTNEQRDVFVIDDFLKRDFREMMPRRGEAELPVSDETFEVDGTGDAWRDRGAVLPLSGLEEGEEVRWLLSGGRLLVYARLRYDGEFQATRESVPALGSCVLLGFSAEGGVSLGDEDVVVVIGDNGQNGVQAWRLQFTDSGAEMLSLEGPAIEGQVEEGWFTWEAELPLLSFVKSEDDLEAFRFNLMSLKLRGERDWRFSGSDITSLFRPATWGFATVKRAN